MKITISEDCLPIVNEALALRKTMNDPERTAVEKTESQTKLYDLYKTYGWLRASIVVILNPDVIARNCLVESFHIGGDCADDAKHKITIDNDTFYIVMTKV